MVTVHARVDAPCVTAAYEPGQKMRLRGPVRMGRMAILLVH